MEPLNSLVVVLSVVNILGLILLLLQSERRTQALHEVLERVVRIEANYEHSPDQGDLSEINESLSALTTDVATINERWQVTNRLMGTIQKHLLEEDRRK